MRRKQILTGSFPFLGILILILDGKTALAGAQAGTDLCIRTVIPSLFPFFFLSVMLNGTVSGFSLPRPVGHLLGIPDGVGSILITGLLGGYPAGAQAVASAYRGKHITKETAERMLHFCSNAGPSFLFGMITPLFADVRVSFLLWGVHILSAILVALVVPSTESLPSSFLPRKEVSPSHSMDASIRIMAKVCGWVILFRILLTFLEHWFLWWFPTAVQVAISGILELSNGCCQLSRLENPGLRFVLCSGMLAWGGLCVVLQTHSVIGELSITPYLKGKALQTLFSLLISSSVVLRIWLPTVFLLLFLTLFLQKMQKRSGNSIPVGV